MVGASRPISKLHTIGKDEKHMVPADPVGALEKEIYVFEQTADKHAPDSAPRRRLDEALTIRRAALGDLIAHGGDVDATIDDLKGLQTQAHLDQDTQARKVIGSKIRVIKRTSKMTNDAPWMARKFEKNSIFNRERFSRERARAKGDFFDPEPPEAPDEILGLPAEPIINLGRAVGKLALIAPGKMPAALRGHAGDLVEHSGHMVSLFPIVERIQAGEAVKPSDVRAYRRAIKESNVTISSIDALAVVASGLLVGIPARKAINRKIEREFPRKVIPALGKAADYLPLIEQEADFIAQFENPREQFVSEIGAVASTIRLNTRKKAYRRGGSKAVLAVTAEDAAAGMRQTIKEILADEEKTKERLPMFAHFAGDKLQGSTLPDADLLAVAAPEIMGAFDAVLAPEPQDKALLQSIIDHPHSDRGLAERFKGSQLRNLRQGTALLFTSVRDLLPARGSEAKDLFQRVETFLKAEQGPPAP
jgi:hypothetical protein